MSDVPTRRRSCNVSPARRRARHPDIRHNLPAGRESPPAPACRPIVGHPFRPRRSGTLAYGCVRPIRHDGGPASYEGVAHRPCPQWRAISMMGATGPDRLRGPAVVHTAAAAPPHAHARFPHTTGRYMRTGTAADTRCRVGRRVVAPMRVRCDGAIVAISGTRRGRRRWPNPPAPRAPATARGR